MRDLDAGFLTMQARSRMAGSLTGPAQGPVCYVAMFEWGYNVKRVTAAFVQALLGVRSATIGPA
jgi:hypothetical protein